MTAMGWERSIDRVRIDPVRKAGCEIAPRENVLPGLNTVLRVLASVEKEGVQASGDR